MLEIETKAPKILAWLLIAQALATGLGCGRTNPPPSSSSSSRDIDDAPLLGDSSMQPVVIATSPGIETPVFPVDPGTPVAVGKVPDLPQGLDTPPVDGAFEISKFESEFSHIPVPKPLAAGGPRAGTDEFNRGLKLAGIKRWPEAIEAFEDSIRLEPTRAEAHLWLGIACLEDNDPLKALPSFDTAIRLDPKSAAAYMQRGSTNLRLHYMAKARADMNQAVALAPKDIQIRTSRAMLNVNERRFEEAEADCSAALAVNPRVLDAYILRCLARLNLSQLVAARADYDKAVSFGMPGDAKKMVESWFAQLGKPIQPKQK